MDDKQRLVELLGQCEKSVNNGDAAGAARLYLEDAVLLPGGFPTAVGATAIGGFYAAAFSQLALTIAFDIDRDEIVVDGDRAFATTSSTGTRVIRATGDTIPEDNRELWIFQKTEDDWRIARYMFNKTGSA